MKEKTHLLLILFYFTLIYLIGTLVFTKLIREPYPSVNMPAFTKSGIKGNIVPAISFQTKIYLKGDIVWEGNFREILNDVPIALYINNTKFIAFNERETRSKEGNELRTKIFSYIPGGLAMYKNLREFVRNEPVGDLNYELSLLLCDFSPLKNLEFDTIEIMEFTDNYHLTDGLVSSDFHRSVKINLTHKCTQ